MRQDLDRHRTPGEPSGPRSADAPTWPVLAQLPRVGVGTSTPPESAPTFAPEPPEASLNKMSSAEPDARRRRFVVDQPHRPPAGAAPQPEPTPVVVENDLTPATSTKPGVRRYRIDQPNSPHPAARLGSSRHEPTTISGSIFRLHAALAPHLSLVGAVTLVVCGSVLYWIAIHRNGGPIDPHRLIEFDAGWSHGESPPAGAPKESVKAAAAPPIDSPPINWTAPPHVADATAATPETEAPAKSSAESAPSVEIPAPTGEAPTTSPAAAAPPVATSPQSPPALDQLASTAPPASESQVTPTPQIEPYPTTPYPAFSFDNPAFLAERPATDSTTVDTPH